MFILYQKAINEHYGKKGLNPALGQLSGYIESEWFYPYVKLEWYVELQGKTLLSKIFFRPQFRKALLFLEKA